jgi:hypothetical protein
VDEIPGTEVKSKVVRQFEFQPSTKVVHKLVAVVDGQCGNCAGLGSSDGLNIETPTPR